MAAGLKKKALSAFSSFTRKYSDQVVTDPLEPPSTCSPLVWRKRRRDASSDSSGSGSDDRTPNNESCASQAPEPDEPVRTRAFKSPMYLPSEQSSPALEKLLQGQDKLMDRLEAMTSQLSPLASENEALRERLQKVEAEAAQNKDWVTKRFNAAEKQMDSIRVHFQKNIDTLKKKVPATSDSAIVADDRRLQSAQLQLQDVSRSTGRAAHDSRLQCPRNTSSLLPHTTTCTGASPTTAEILSILGEERDKQERASNFVLHGLAEGAGATDREEVLKLFPHLAEATEIFRLGREAPSPTSKPRPLLVKTTRPYKSEAFRAKNRLREKSLFLNHDLTRDQQRRRRDVVATYKELRRRSVRCSLPYDLILIDGRPITDEDVAKYLSDSNDPQSSQASHTQ